jgi:hypothetical protein
LARFSQRDGTRAVHHTSVPKQIAVLLENWLKAAPLGRPPAGPHIWTAPANKISGDIDIEIKNGSRACRHPIERAIISSMGTGAIVAPTLGDMRGSQRVVTRTDNSLSHIFQAIFYVSGLSRHNKVSQIISRLAPENSIIERECNDDIT